MIQFIILKRSLWHLHGEKTLGSGGKDRGKVVLLAGPTWEAVTKPSPPACMDHSPGLFIYCLVWFGFGVKLPGDSSVQ